MVVAPTRTDDSRAATRASTPRPTLVPGVRRLWRSRTTLQLGADPAQAVVLDLAEPALAQLLDLCDGTRSERTIVSAAATHGIAEERARALLGALRQAGVLLPGPNLLPAGLSRSLRQRLTDEAAALAMRGGTGHTPAHVLRRRLAARVLVTGHGPVLEPVALTLAQAGVGHVCPVVQPTERTPPRPARPATRTATEVAAAVRRAAPGTRTGPLRPEETTFVVQLGCAEPAPRHRARHRPAQLPVTIRDGSAVVGPLAPPAGGPCLHCVELHRRDRDSDWPALAVQLATPSHDPCAAATVVCAAGLAAGEVLSWIDGVTPSTVGASLELTGPGAPRRRTWQPHPGCPCAAEHLEARPC